MSRGGTCMSNRTFRVAATGLSGLFAAQLVILAADRASPPVPPRLNIGDTVLAVGVSSSSRTDCSLPLARSDGSYTAIFGFHSECAWCNAVAAEWRALFADPYPGVVYLAVSREPIEPATAYALAHEWSVPVASVQRAVSGFGVETNFVARTPWIFLFDGDGVLVTAVNGAEYPVVREILGSRPALATNRPGVVDGSIVCDDA